MKFVILITLSVALAACASGMRSEKHYFPPASASAGNCTENCAQQRRQCQVASTAPNPGPPAAAESEYEKCSKRSYEDYEQCRVRTRGDPSQCYRATCVVQPGASTTNLAAPDCDQAFDRCFTACGGRIETRQVCERNC